MVRLCSFPEETQSNDFGSVGGVSLVHLEAVGAWQWCNFLGSLAPAGKQVVRINLDETCCRLCLEATKGAVAVGRNRSRKEALIGEHKASLSARRMAVTLVASVCDDTEIQALLPQVILGNERVLSKGEAHRINAEPDACVYCVRQKSGWVNKDPVEDHASYGGCAEAMATDSVFCLVHGCVSLPLQRRGRSSMQ